jgi:PAS domain S-box-containing protein
MVLFSILEFFCLLSAFTTCALGFFVYAKSSESAINRLFLACMLGTTYWAIGEFFFWQAETYDGALIWLKVSAFWPVVIVLSAHFVLAYTEHPLAQPGKSRLLLICLYVPAVIFTLLGLFTDMVYFVVNKAGTGFVYTPDVTGPVYPVECIFIVMVMLGAIFAGYSAWKKADSAKKRRQVRLICIALATAIGFGAISGIILPLFRIYPPNCIFIGLFLFSLIITYAITRYGLFTLSPETALPYILRTMPDGFILMAMDGRIITVNASAARIFRVEEKNTSGQLASELIPEPAYGNVMTMIREQGTFLDLEAVLDQKENKVVSIAGSQVRDPGGAPAGIVLIIRDISSRKRQERALRVANEKISLLTHLTSHDINNLVTGLSGYLLLLEAINTSPPGDSYVHNALEVVDKISRHLWFSSEYLHLGTYQPDWQPLAIVMARAVNDLPHEGIEITTQIPPAEIYADPLSGKVIYNLLENALHHGMHLTTIHITASEGKNGDLVVVFEDNGVGIADGEKEHIFQYGVGKHSGLGLAFTRDILGVTGITIAETGTPGKGARFELHIPPAAWRRT